MPLCGLGNSRIARSGKPLGFLRHRNRRLKRFHPHRTARCRSSRCKSREPSAMETRTLEPLLHWDRPSRLPGQRDQEGRPVQGDRFRLFRLEDLEAQGRPLDQVGLRRKRPIQALRRRPHSERAAFLLSSSRKRMFYRVARQNRPLGTTVRCRSQFVGRERSIGAPFVPHGAYASMTC